MPDDGLKDKTPDYDQIYGASAVTFYGGGAVKWRRTTSATTLRGAGWILQNPCKHRALHINA